MPCEPKTLGSVGVFTSMLVEPSDTTDPCLPATFDSSSERYEILQENIRYTDVLLGGNGFTGTIDRTAVHTRHGARVVVGSFVMEVGPYELASWLPRINGNAPVGNVYAPAEEFDLTPFDIMMKRDQGTVIYRHCGVRSATFNAVSSVGGPEQVMRMTIEIIGFEEHDATFPATPPLLPSSDRLYWILGDGQLHLQADPTASVPAPQNEEWYFDSFSLRIDNNLTPILRNFHNVTAIQSRGREVTFRASMPYDNGQNAQNGGSHNPLYIDFFKGNGTLSFLSTKSNELQEIHPNYSTVISLNDLRSIRRTPNATGPGEVPLFLDMKAHRAGGATAQDPSIPPISITNVVA